MFVLALALAVAVQQDSAVIDQPVYTSAEWGVALRRPFDDWVFSPATTRGTTTVIFQPRDASLSAQLWGALILSPWGRAVPLRDVASRRIASTWRSTLGPTFRMLARDSLDLAGQPAIHLVMSGTVQGAALEVEEYLLARDSELIALQFRYPRGLPRDSLAAGYLRSLTGFTVRAREREVVVASASPPASVWQLEVHGGLLLFDLPQEYQAIAPGWLSSEAITQGRRLMRWTPVIGGPDTSLYAVGRFNSETRRAGRLSFRIWRNLSADTGVTHATDAMLARLADTWAVYWRDFGPVPTTEIGVVETAWRETRGGPGVIYLGADARSPSTGDNTIRREVSRSWWGGMVRANGPAERLISELLPAWSVTLAGGPADSTANAIEGIRRAAGDAAFREAIRTFILASRGGVPALDSFLSALGDSAAAKAREVIR